MQPDNPDTQISQFNGNDLVSSPATAYIVPPGGSRIQEAHEGFMTLSEDYVIRLEQDTGETAFELPVKEIAEVDFTFRLSPSAQFRMRDNTGTLYTVMLDDIYKPQNSLLMVSPLLDLLLMKRRIRGMNSFAIWKRTLTGLLPAEKIHKPSQLQQIPGAIGLAILIAFGLFFVLFAIAWFI